MVDDPANAARKQIVTGYCTKTNMGNNWQLALFLCSAEKAQKGGGKKQSLSEVLGGKVFNVDCNSLQEELEISELCKTKLTSGKVVYQYVSLRQQISNVYENDWQ